MLGFFHTQQKMYALAILFNINILKNVVFSLSLHYSTILIMKFNTQKLSALISYFHCIIKNKLKNQYN